jgi:hypothetical protein
MAVQIILVGGFLGAGKTTLLLQAARELAARGRRVGLVTNDQAGDLVDTALAVAGDIPVAEVAGGCFCCRFPDLLAAIERLHETVAPEIILAEPVGSCTDLIATVLRPLRAFHGDQFEVAPLTVLLDPQRDLSSFPPEVNYLYRQQLAEAEIIGVTKVDQLEEPELRTALHQSRVGYPSAHVLGLAARTGQGVGEWLALCEGGRGVLDRALELDYQRYTDAEACLGWLNATGELRGERPFAADAWMAGALQALDQALIALGAPVAHIKLQLEAPQATLKASLTQSGAPISWDLHADGVRIDRARLLLNARVHTDPATLERAVRQIADQTPSWIRCTFTNLESLSPLPPQPTHRIVEGW